MFRAHGSDRDRLSFREMKIYTLTDGWRKKNSNQNITPFKRVCRRHTCICVRWGERVCVSAPWTFRWYRHGVGVLARETATMQINIISCVAHPHHYSYAVCKTCTQTCARSTVVWHKWNCARCCWLDRISMAVSRLKIASCLMVICNNFTVISLDWRPMMEIFSIISTSSMSWRLLGSISFDFVFANTLDKQRSLNSCSINLMRNK